MSRPADEGLFFLGDLLFERGEFRAAEQVWRPLLPDGGADIPYPGSGQDPAAVRARIVLAIIYQGELDRAARELIAFRRLHPGASGSFAGKIGPLAETLQGVLDNPPAISPQANAGANWPSFGGGPDRSGRVSERLSGEWPSQPTWREQLPSGKRHGDAPIGPPRRPPFGHPVVLGEHVFVTDGSQVLGFQLLTGRRIPALELVPTSETVDGKIPPPDPCPTLSADGDRLYIRVGPGVIGSAKGNDQTAIACVRLIPAPDGSCTLKEQWRVKPPHLDDGTGTWWEGAPVVFGRRMWSAFVRFGVGGSSLNCLLRPERLLLGPEPAWTTDVCDGPVSGNEGRARHELLTLAGRNIVFCSNTGAVMALDAATGRRAWGFRYSRSRQTEAAHSPHPAPVVSSGGRLFVSPADGDRVYALDPENGIVLWQSGRQNGARLGVSAGRLIVTVLGPVRGIRGLSVETGSIRPPDGWIQHDGTGILGYGQGFVTDDIIVWPTRAGLLFLRSEDGLPLGDSRPSPFVDANANYFGNIVCASSVRT